jgi:peptidoglycan/LPS O-acetylase OafA/YrhL
MARAWFATCPLGGRAWAADLLLLGPYLGVSATLAVSWTLVYELGFYLCAAAALATWRGRHFGGRPLFVVGTLLCFAPWCWNAAAGPWLVLGLWANFFAGTAAWWIVRRGACRAGGSVLVTLAIVTIIQGVATSAWNRYDIAPGRLTALATAFVLVGLHRPGERFGLTQFGVGLRWLGRISYSLYLVHTVVMTPLQNLGTRFVSPASPVFVLVWLALLGSALVSGWLLNRWVETPLQRRQKAWACAAS